MLTAREIQIFSCQILGLYIFVSCIFNGEHLLYDEVSYEILYGFVWAYGVF
jgi:hypothetical protein